MVTGAEFTVAAGVGTVPAIGWVVYSAELDPAVLEDGASYEWVGKRTGPIGNMLFLGAGLRPKVGDGEELCAEVAEVQVKTFVFDCEARYLSRAFKYNAADFPAGTVFYFEASWNDGETVNLLDTGTEGTPIDPPTIVSGSPLTFPGIAAYTTLRSGPITLIDQHWYTVTIDPDTEPQVDVTAYIIADLPPLS